MEPRDQKRKQKKKSGFANDIGSRIKRKENLPAVFPRDWRTHPMKKEDR